MSNPIYPISSTINIDTNERDVISLFIMEQVCPNCHPPSLCRSCAAKKAHTRRHPINPEFLDMLAETVTDDVKQSLTKTSEIKVDVVCSHCHEIRHVTFWCAYKQRSEHPYICRSCQAKENGKLAPKGLTKRTQTMIEKFGVEHHMKLPEIRKKMYDTNLQRYGVKYVGSTLGAKEKTKSTYLARYGGHPFSNTDVRCKIHSTMLERYGTINPGAGNYHSQAENDIRIYLETLTSQSWPSTWSIITPLQLDGYCEARQMAFEYCGLFWHTDQNKHDKHSHERKYQECREKGIKLYTIFEDEWNERSDQIRWYLSGQLGIFTTRYYARDVACRPIDPKLAQRFINARHIQPLTQSPSHAWGLWTDDVLLSVMTFRPHHRSNHTTDIVLNRFVSLPGVQVVGGASRLLSHAVKEMHQFTRIISWSDHRWSWGNVYQQLGFTQDGILEPDYSYYDGSQHRRSKQSSTKEKIGATDTQTESERAAELGWARIWDCGKTRWVLPIN